jgi:hypothetical protein
VVARVLAELRAERLVRTSPGRVEILDGDARTSESREPGFTKFVPRDRQHAYASVDDKPFEILSVAVK